MAFVFLLGGARSGKSALAVRLASTSRQPVHFIATATPSDPEFAARIALHRAERPRGWTTVEEPVDLAGALAAVPSADAAVVDCLTLWVANVLDRTDDDIAAAAIASAAAARSRSGHTVVVSNEVGSGVVPVGALARRYRDVLGRVNAVFADAADRALLVVAGRTLPLSPAPTRLDG